LDLRLELLQRLGESVFHVSPHHGVCSFRVTAENGFDEISVKAGGQNSTLSGNVIEELQMEHMVSLDGLRKGVAMSAFSDARVQLDVPPVDIM
jgi:hypothetical protein